MTAVAVWDHRPDADELLRERLKAGWRPTPSYLVDGPQVLGHAAKLPPELWTRPGDRPKERHYGACRLS